MMTFCILLISYALCMGWVGRMDGGGPPKTPEWFERFLVMAPVMAFGSLFGFWPMLFAEAGIVGRITGHGQYFLARMVKAIEPEFFDFIVRPLFGADPRTLPEFADLIDIPVDNIEPERLKEIAEEMDAYGWNRLYWRCVMGMSVTGLVVMLPLALIVVSHLHLLAAGIIIIAGLQKGLSYMVGYHIELKRLNQNFPMYLSGSTEIAEFLNWFNATLLLGVAYLVMT